MGRTWILQSEIARREHFGLLLNKYGLTNLAVEVGTHQGLFAAEFMTHWEGRRLYCIDCWAPYDDSDLSSLGDREADYRLAQDNLASFRRRLQFKRSFSKEAVKDFEDQSIDFAYIDACHQYESVVEDLNLWWPKVHSEGLLAGHDIVCPGEVNGGWAQSVSPAVIEFGQSQNLPIYVVPQDLYEPWSYYFIKP